MASPQPTVEPCKCHSEPHGALIHSYEPIGQPCEPIATHEIEVAFCAGSSRVGFAFCNSDANGQSKRLNGTRWRTSIGLINILTARFRDECRSSSRPAIGVTSKPSTFCSAIYCRHETTSKSMGCWPNTSLLNRVRPLFTWGRVPQGCSMMQM